MPTSDLMSRAAAPCTGGESDRSLLSLIVETQREITAAGSDVEAVTELVHRRSQALTGAGGGPLTEAHGQAREVLSVLLAAAVSHAHDALTGLPNRAQFRGR